MMNYQFSPVLNRLMEHFGRLPGIGPKTAQRLAFYMLKQPRDRVQDFADALTEAKDRVVECPICHNLTDESPCVFCRDETRDTGLICVVEEVQDLLSIERVRDYRGAYHVLHGAISPMEGKDPGDLRIQELLNRLAATRVREVILATDPDVEGETTALYLSRLIRPMGIRVTRIAHGIPVGSNLEHADTATLSQAMQGRREMD
jgi:recombination protein RecR